MKNFRCIKFSSIPNLRKNFCQYGKGRYIHYAIFNTGSKHVTGIPNLVPSLSNLLSRALKKIGEAGDEASAFPQDWKNHYPSIVEE